jgi:EAL domain-containing protein (putative c-di-GMP-specific phosphodiesterase class I)
LPHGGSAFPGIDITDDDPDALDRIGEILALGQVHSDFQPIFDVDSGAVVAYEALARGPQGPLRRADQLFAAARAANRLCELDVLCRRSAIRGAIEAGIHAPLTLFVNIEPEIVDVTQLEELLRMTDSVPDPERASRMNLVLEITEREIATRPAELLATVRRLRMAGWRIALDDVGADDISIAFMPLLRPDIVKLDLQLVQHRPSPKIAEIMNAVNAYAERTGSVILCEGIEDEKHLATARALGARLVQGYLLGRPQPGTTPGVTIGELALPAMRSTPAQLLSPFDRSPFDRLPAAAVPRFSTKPLLIEVSKHLERQALRLGKTCIVLSTFQEARHFGAPTVRRYQALADQTGFVAAIGAGLPSEPAAGVRGADLDPGDPVRGEWDIVVLAPHFAAALIAREIGDTTLPDLERTFEFVLSYDRATVEAAAQSLMARISPRSIPAAISFGP